MIGLSYCIYAVTSWTLIPVLVNPSSLGTAIGIAYIIRNVGQYFGSFLVSFFIVANNPSITKYDYAIVFYLI